MNIMKEMLQDMTHPNAESLRKRYPADPSVIGENEEEIQTHKTETPEAEKEEPENKDK